MLVLIRWTGREWVASADHETWDRIPLRANSAERAISVAAALFPGCLVAVCGPYPLTVEQAA